MARPLRLVAGGQNGEILNFTTRHRAPYLSAEHWVERKNFPRKSPPLKNQNVPISHSNNFSFPGNTNP